MVTGRAASGTSSIRPNHCNGRRKTIRVTERAPAAEKRRGFCDPEHQYTYQIHLPRAIRSILFPRNM
jgi:hypothetical protein